MSVAAATQTQKILWERRGDRPILGPAPCGVTRQTQPSEFQARGFDREWYDAELCRLVGCGRALTAASLLSSYVSQDLAGSIPGPASLFAKLGQEPVREPICGLIARYSAANW